MSLSFLVEQLGCNQEKTNPVEFFPGGDLARGHFRVAKTCRRERLPNDSLNQELTSCNPHDVSLLLRATCRAIARRERRKGEQTIVYDSLIWQQPSNDIRSQVVNGTPQTPWCGRISALSAISSELLEYTLPPSVAWCTDRFGRRTLRNTQRPSEQVKVSSTWSGSLQGTL